MRHESKNYLMKSAIKLVILLIVFFEARAVWPTDGNDLDQATEVVKKSKETRSEINKNPIREVASLGQQEARHKEFEKVMEDENEKNWFQEVDKLIKN